MVNSNRLYSLKIPCNPLWVDIFENPFLVHSYKITNLNFNYASLMVLPANILPRTLPSPRGCFRKTFLSAPSQYKNMTKFGFPSLIVLAVTDRGQAFPFFLLAYWILCLFPECTYNADIHLSARVSEWAWINVDQIEPFRRQTRCAPDVCSFPRGARPPIMASNDD